MSLLFWPLSFCLLLISLSLPCCSTRSLHSALKLIIQIKKVSDFALHVNFQEQADKDSPPNPTPRGPGCSLRLHSYTLLRFQEWLANCRESIPGTGRLLGLTVYLSVWHTRRYLLRTTRLHGRYFFICRLVGVRWHCRREWGTDKERKKETSCLPAWWHFKWTVTHSGAQSFFSWWMEQLGGGRSVNPSDCW